MCCLYEPDWEIDKAVPRKEELELETVEKIMSVETSRDLPTTQNALLPTVFYNEKT